MDEYCELFLEKYGEKSEIFRTIDAEYYKVKSVDGTWVSFWNELRKKLYDCGVENEVMEQDRIFIEKIKNGLERVSKASGKTISELRRNYVPMSKRWGNEKF